VILGKYGGKILVRVAVISLQNLFGTETSNRKPRERRGLTWLPLCKKKGAQGHGPPPQWCKIMLPHHAKYYNGHIWELNQSSGPHRGFNQSSGPHRGFGQVAYEHHAK
jgi:hypothetical protein